MPRESGGPVAGFLFINFLIMTPFSFGILLLVIGFLLFEVDRKYRYKIKILSPYAKSGTAQLLQFVIGGITFGCFFVGGGIVLMGLISLIFGIPFNEWD